MDGVYSDSKVLLDKLEIMPGRMYFSIVSTPKLIPKGAGFSVDVDPRFQYVPFYYDFGPPSLLHIHRFVKLVRRYLEKKEDTLIYYCVNKSRKIANAICFASCFRMIHLGLSADDAYSPFLSFPHKIRPYRDATTIKPLYPLTIISCLKGLEKALKLGWYDYELFDARRWEYFERVENGDMNWLIPDKILAFASPYSTNILNGTYRVSTPDDLVLPFKRFGINHIIRLCDPCYDSDVFKKAGFKHTDLIFADGSNPPYKILKQFLKIAETDEVIAVHCQAGLGRTGTLAACYMIKNFNFRPGEAIGWCRLCRPGSVIGPQQLYLFDYRSTLKRSLARKVKDAGAEVEKGGEAEKGDETEKGDEVEKGPERKYNRDSDRKRDKKNDFSTTPKTLRYSSGVPDGLYTPQPRKYLSHKS